MLDAESLVRADLGAPLCPTCEDTNIYDRSPERCPRCAALRVAAVLVALADQAHASEASAIRQLVEQVSTLAQGEAQR